MATKYADLGLPALPVVGKYPYAIVVYNNAIDITQVVLLSLPAIYSIEESHIKSTSGTYGNLYALKDGVWNEMVTDFNIGSSLQTDLESALWSNHDILDENGTVRFEGEKTQTSSYDETSFKIGLALGLCGKGVPKDLQIIAGEVFVWNVEDGFLGETTIPGDNTNILLYKLSNYYFSYDQLVGSTLTVAFEDGSTQNITLNESNMDVVESGTTVVLEYFLVIDGNSGIFEDVTRGIWVVADALAQYQNLSSLTLTM